MRLLNTSTLQVEEFIGDAIPEYVILSHTWSDEEVSFQDMQSGAGKDKAGYLKIEGCCKRAALDGYEHVWIDTCCIDKTSSAELSEAINSMYYWYKNANICYAYLADIASNQGVREFTKFEINSHKTSSRWFLRGWTLQELIAPKTVEFYAADWSEIGTKACMAENLSKITGITLEVLKGSPPASCSIADRMSWAAQRRTTRAEDMAYCLLGIFNVNMPLLYGEGNRAFLRLQEEIMKVSEDYTLFAWSNGPSDRVGLLAASIGQFNKLETVPEGAKYSYEKTERIQKDLVSIRETNIGSVVGIQDSSPPPLLTSRGLRVTLPVRENGNGLQAYFYCRMLSGSKEDLLGRPVILNLCETAGKDTFLRISGGPVALSLISNSNLAKFQLRTIYIAQDMQSVAAQMIPRSRWGHQHMAFELVFEQSCVDRLSYANSFPGLVASKWIMFEGDTKAYAAAILLRETAYTVRNLSITPKGPSKDFQLHVGIHNDRPWCQFIGGRITFTEVGGMQKLLHDKAPPNLVYQDRAVRALPSSEKDLVKAAVRRRPGGKIESFDRDICTVHISIS